MDFGVSWNAAERHKPNTHDDESCDNDTSSSSSTLTDTNETVDDDDEAEISRKELMSRKELKLLKVAQLKTKLKAAGLKVTGKKEELIERLLNPELHRKKPHDWKNSKAKALLKKLLQDKDSRIHTMTAREIYDSHLWYKQYHWDRFKINLANLQQSVKENSAIVEEEINIVREELRNFPQSNQSCRGYPRWDKHPARLLLRQDIKEGRYELGTAKEFQKTRDEYTEFPLATFRSHIHQERRRQRELPMKVVQRNKKALKAHETEVNKQEQCWS